MSEERCVCCGAVIPEGRQVCPKCEEGDIELNETNIFKKIWKWVCENVAWAVAALLVLVLVVSSAVYSVVELVGYYTASAAAEVIKEESDEVLQEPVEAPVVDELVEIESKTDILEEVTEPVVEEPAVKVETEKKPVTTKKPSTSTSKPKPEPEKAPEKAPEPTVKPTEPEVTVPETTEPPKTEEPPVAPTEPEVTEPPVETTPEPTEPVVESYPITPPQTELQMLACVIFQEAGGSAHCNECRRRVADVVLNRIADSRYPNTMRGVLTQKSQYGRMHWTGVVWPSRAKKAAEKPSVERAYRIAAEVLSGQHSDLYGNGYIYQAEFRQGKDNIYCCGHYFGR